jgi:hypothetical protein
MTQEDIIRMAREAGFHEFSRGLRDDGSRDTYLDCWPENLERFAALVAAAEREKLAHWMRNLGYATGHGDTIEDLLDHLGTQIAEGLEAEVLMEREACARIAETTVCDTHLPTGVQIYGSKAAAAIRARGKK